MFLTQAFRPQSLLFCPKALLSLSRQGLLGAALPLEQGFVTRLSFWGPCHAPSLSTAPETAGYEPVLLAAELKQLRSLKI